MIGVAKDIAQGMVKLDAMTAANAVTVISIANLSGRLVLGIQHPRQHPVLGFTHGLSQGEVILHHAVNGFHFLLRCVFHQGRAKQDHHQDDSPPDHEGFFEANRRQQMRVDKFDPVKLRQMVPGA